MTIININVNGTWYAVQNYTRPCADKIQFRSSFDVKQSTQSSKFLYELMHLEHTQRLSINLENSTYECEMNLVKPVFETRIEEQEISGFNTCRLKVEGWNQGLVGTDVHIELERNTQGLSGTLIGSFWLMLSGLNIDDFTKPSSLLLEYADPYEQTWNSLFKDWNLNFDEHIKAKPLITSGETMGAEIVMSFQATPIQSLPVY